MAAPACVICAKGISLCSYMGDKQSTIELLRILGWKKCMQLYSFNKGHVVHLGGCSCLVPKIPNALFNTSPLPFFTILLCRHYTLKSILPFVDYLHNRVIYTPWYT